MERGKIRNGAKGAKANDRAYSNFQNPQRNQNQYKRPDWWG